MNKRLAKKILKNQDTLQYNGLQIQKAKTTAARTQRRAEAGEAKKAKA